MAFNSFPDKHLKNTWHTGSAWNGLPGFLSSLTSPNSGPQAQAVFSSHPEPMITTFLCLLPVTSSHPSTERSYSREFLPRYNGGHTLLCFPTDFLLVPSIGYNVWVFVMWPLPQRLKSMKARIRAGLWTVLSTVWQEVSTQELWDECVRTHIL